MELPPVTQQPVFHINGVPDDQYALRILEVYRANCDVHWAVRAKGLSEGLKKAYRAMNKAQDQRMAQKYTNDFGIR